MTICEKCGSERQLIPEPCPICQFQPKTTRELATASLLTSRFEAGEDSFGMQPELLRTIAQQIRQGIHPKLDKAELDRHERTVAAFLQIRPVNIWWYLFRFFLPAIVLLVALCGISFALRAILR